MGFTPTYGADSISVHIGTVGGGAMTEGSPNLGPVGFSPLPGHTTARYFSAEDIGCIVAVLGAGPDGGILVGTIVSFTDTQNVVLDTAASTSVAGDNANTMVFRPCEVMMESFQHEGSLTSRNTGSFTARSLDGTFVPTEGQPVIFVSSDPAVGDDLGVFFGGSIDSVAVQNYPGSTLLTSECQCISWEMLASKRVMMGKTYLTEHAGTIFTDLVTRGLVGECVGVSAVEGPVVDSLTIDDYTVVSDALDRVAQAVSTATDVYYWKMDPWRRAIFALQTTTPAPWGIKESDTSDGNILASLKITRTREKYSNHAYIEASKRLNSPQTYSVKINTSGPVPVPPGYASRTITLPAIPAVVPTMTLDGSSLVVRATGDDPRTGSYTVPDGADWAWLVGTDYLWTDSAHPGLTVNHTIVVTYQTADVGHAFAAYAPGVDERAAVEAGSGYYETVVKIDQPVSQDEAVAFADSVAQRYGQIPTVIDLETYRSGLDVGQSIPVSMREVTGDFVISSVSLTVEDGWPKWSVTATNGSIIGDWRAAFIGAFGGGLGVAGGGGAGVTIGAQSAPQGINRTVSANDSQVRTDELILFDTSAIATSTDTLGAAVTDTTGDSWTFGSGANIVNGTYVQVGSEKVYVVAGTGANRTVARGALGTTAATHSNGATVTVPGALAFSLLAISEVPNVSLILRKSSSDLNYVKILAAGGDSFPGGTAFLLLPDNSTDKGTVYLRAPAPPDTEWIQLASAGAPGPAGPPGESGTATPAPNILSDGTTVTMVPQAYGHEWRMAFQIVIALPTSDVEFSHLKQVEIRSGQLADLVSAPFYSSDWSGSTVTLLSKSYPYMPGTYGFEFDCFNETGTRTDNPVTKTVTVPAMALSATQTATDRADLRYGYNGGLRTVLSSAPAVTNGQYPLTLTAWRNEGSGQKWTGWFVQPSAGAAILIGAQGSPTEGDIIPPTAADGSWTLTWALGAIDSAAAIPSGSVTTSAFPVARPAAPTATISDSATATTPTYQPQGGGSSGYTFQVRFKLPLTEPAFKHGRLYRRTGSYVGGVFTPGGAGAEWTAIGDWAGPKPGYAVEDHAACFKLESTVEAGWIIATLGADWGTVSSQYPVIQLKLGVAYRRDSGDGSDATETLQTTWPGGLAYYDVVLDATKSRADARMIDPTTLGFGLSQDSNGRPQTVPSTNKLLNWSFDQAGGFFPQWSTPGGPPVYWSTQSETAGGHSWAVGYGSDGYAVQYDTGNLLSVHLGETWYMSFRYKRASAAGRLIYYVYLRAADGTQVGSPATLTEAAGTIGWTTQSAVFTIPAGVAGLTVILTTDGQTSGDSFVDWVHLDRQVSTGAGTEPDGKGGVQVKIDPAAPVTTDADGNVTLKLSSGVGKDGSGNLVVRNGQGITFDSSGNVVPNAGPGLTFNAGGALVPNQGATVGVNASGQLIVPAGSLGLTQFGGVYQPYAFYYGLPSPTDASVPKLIINTADWKIYRNTGGSWSKQQDPADLIAGTITALVSLISPAISGGSITGSSFTCSNANGSVNVNTTDFIKILGPSGFQAVLNWVSLQLSQGSYTFTATPYGFQTRLVGVNQGYSVVPTGISVTDNIGQVFNSVSGVFSYVKPGGTTGTIQVAQGIITAIT